MNSYFKLSLKFGIYMISPKHDSIYSRKFSFQIDKWYDLYKNIVLKISTVSFVAIANNNLR